MNSAQVVLSLLGSSSVVAVATTVITAIFNKRKLGADATQIITQAAVGVVDTLKTENARLVARVDAVEVELSDARDKATAWYRTLQLHVAWDHLSFQKLTELGVADWPEPPPVYPPTATPSGSTEA